MQPIVPGMAPAEAYAIIAAMAAAVANPLAAAGTGALPLGSSTGMPALAMAGRPHTASGGGAPPRLGASASSAFAQYKPPQPQLCAPPVHGPPKSSISLGPGVAVPQPLRPTMPPLPGLVTSAGLPAGMPLPTTMQGFAEALKAAAAAQQLQAQQQQQQQAAASTAGSADVAPSAAPAASPMPTAASPAPAAGSAASAAPSAVSGRAGASASAASEKLKASRTRYQEKNRRAQARFRERQKAKQNEVSSRMEELEARLNQLTVERDQLSVRAATLQQCLAQRQAVVSDSQPQESAGPGDGGGSSGSGESPKSAGQTTSSANASADSQQKSGSGGRAATVKYSGDLPKTWEEFTRWYEGVIQELAPLLAPAQTGDHPEAAARVETLWFEFIEVLQQCFVRNEGVRTRCHTGPCVPEGAAAVPPPTAELWAKVTAALQLSEEQVAHMVRARREFLASLKALLQQRRALSDIISATIAKDCDSNPAVSVQHTKCVEVVHLLERNVKEQCRLNTRLGRDMWDRLMTPLQGATACVGMYPFVPDKLAVLTVVAVRAGEPDAATLLSDDPPVGMRPSDQALATDSGAATDASNAMVSGSD